MCLKAWTIWHSSEGLQLEQVSMDCVLKTPRPTHTHFLFKTWNKRIFVFTANQTTADSTCNCATVTGEHIGAIGQFKPKFLELMRNVGFIPEAETKTKEAGRIDTVYYRLAQQGGRLWTLNLPAFPPFSCVRRQLLWFTFVLGLRPYRSLGNAGHVRLNPASPLQQ